MIWSLLIEVGFFVDYTLLNKDLFQWGNSYEAIFTSLHLWEEGFIEKGNRIGYDVNKFDLAWISGKVPSLFMISQADSRGRISL